MSFRKGLVPGLDRVCRKRVSVYVFLLFGWRDRLVRHVQTVLLCLTPESPLPPTLHLPQEHRSMQYNIASPIHF